MFGIGDLPKFFLAFFVVLPVISLLHEGGHVFFAWLMGGKNIKVRIGSGKPLFRLGILDVRQYYFWYGFCSFENLERNKRFSNILIFSGGTLFNALAAVAVILLVEHQLLETGMLTYQFTYFSLYYIFFAILPMPYPDGSYSDGKIILDLLLKRRSVMEGQIFWIQWDDEKKQWCILDHNRKFLQGYTKEEEALQRAREFAQQKRPSRIIHTKKGKEEEIQNYPKIPL